MTQPAPPVGPGIGVCLRDFQIFVVTYDRSLCFVCARPPDYVIQLDTPFDAAAGQIESEVETPLAPEAPTIFTTNCPYCQGHLQVVLSDDLLQVNPVTPAAAAEEAAEPVAPAEPPASSLVGEPASAGQPSPGELPVQSDQPVEAAPHPPQEPAS
jgi:hypothetical protein